MPAKLTTKQFVERATVIHDGRYDYSRVDYTHSKTKVEIICLRHGSFMQSPECHLYGKCGCPVCRYGGTVEERFWSYVNKNGERQPHMDSRCWIWTGSIHYKGYGVFTGHNSKATKAHVFSYQLHYGSIPEADNFCGRLFVCHHCDNPECARPEHLFVGTNQDNMSDAVTKGRFSSMAGEKAGNSKLTWDKVAEIRRMLKETSLFQREIAEMFGVHEHTISCIARNKTWVI